MEFYGGRKRGAFGAKLVSIPNGMEFYRIALDRPYAKHRFQFPTGWNSTAAKIAIHATAGVSIPNGMEFYGI